MNRFAEDHGRQYPSGLPILALADRKDLGAWDLMSARSIGFLGPLPPTRHGFVFGATCERDLKKAVHLGVSYFSTGESPKVAGPDPDRE